MALTAGKDDITQNQTTRLRAASPVSPKTKSISTVRASALPRVLRTVIVEGRSRCQPARSQPCCWEFVWGFDGRVSSAGICYFTRNSVAM